MTIIKQAFAKKYFCMSNELAQNNKLSLRARGLMAYFLSLPDHWEIHINHLVKVLQEGRHVIRETLIELKAAGYVHHIKTGFKEGWQYYVFPEPYTEDEFKEFLRTIRFPNCSISEQFENRPLENTNPSRNDISERNPPLTPPREKTKKEEDLSSKGKKEDASREGKLQKIIEKWIKEGRPQKVIDAVVKTYYEQPLGTVKHITKWLETVYAQKFECADAEELYERRRQFAENIEKQCGSNYYYAKHKDLIAVTSGATETLFDIKGIKKGSEEFWEKNKLGKKAFVKWKQEQRSSHVASSV